MSEAHPIAERPWLEGSHLEDLKLAATKMRGEERRSFQAEMARKYCGGNPRQAEVVFGWNRHTAEVGLHEQCTGLICRGAHEAFCGNKRGEDRHPEVAEALWVLAESHAQQGACLHTVDGGRGAQATTRPRVCGSGSPLAEHDGRHIEPQWLPVAAGGEGQTPKKYPKPMPSLTRSRPRIRAAPRAQSCG